MPPGDSQWPLSRRSITRTRSSSSMTTPATLTECVAGSLVTSDSLLCQAIAHLENWRRAVHGLGSVDRLADAPPYRQIADQLRRAIQRADPVSYTHLRAHETDS